jgi:UPF0716 protein FxsA
MRTATIAVPYASCYYRGLMLSMKALMRFLDRSFILKLLLLVMLYSLIPFGEFFLLLFLNNYIESFILLSMVAGTTLLGLLLILRPVTTTLVSLHSSIDEGYYPDEPFAMLAGTLFTGVLLLTPGFVSDALGIIFLIPVLRRGIGRLFTKRMHDKLMELYEYIKLYER